MKPSIGSIRAKADWLKVCGALLLGVNSVVIIAPGRSDAEATRTRHPQGRRAVRGNVGCRGDGRSHQRGPPEGERPGGNCAGQDHATRVVITGIGTVDPVTTTPMAFLTR